MDLNELTGNEVKLLLGAATVLGGVIGATLSAVITARFTRNQSIALEAHKERRERADAVGAAYLAMRETLGHAMTRTERAHATTRITTATPADVGAAQQRLVAACDNWLTADAYASKFVKSMHADCTRAVDAAYNYLHSPTDPNYVALRNAVRPLGDYEGKMEAFTRAQRRERRRGWWRVSLFA